MEFGVTTNGYVEVFTRDDADPFISQRYTTYNDGRIFNRVNNSGVWTSWKELAQNAVTSQYTDIALINGAQAYASAGYNPQVARVGNQVYVRGELAYNTVQVGTIIGYLPAGYRPSQMHRYLQSSVSQTNTMQNRWSIATNGAIKLESSTSDSNVSRCYRHHIVIPNLKMRKRVNL
ncbi:pyocin knob domain-containing protein [Exiguobacterium sp. SL14]|nr:pyocin knob domain-containing protein [Exiguobacterium sp. SL14]MCY1690759.1 pyocin knob domain-containing protein [Exiguobacterium sp. SL14]